MFTAIGQPLPYTRRRQKIFANIFENHLLSESISIQFYTMALWLHQTFTIASVRLESKYK